MDSETNDPHRPSGVGQYSQDLGGKICTISPHACWLGQGTDRAHGMHLRCGGLDQSPLAYPLWDHSTSSELPDFEPCSESHCGRYAGGLHQTDALECRISRSAYQQLWSFRIECLHDCHSVTQTARERPILPSYRWWEIRILADWFGRTQSSRLCSQAQQSSRI